MEVNGQIASRPYVMYIPGFEGIVSVRYFLDEVEWRDTGIFDYKIDDISSVKLKYPTEPSSSFQIQVVNKDSFFIVPSDGSGDNLKINKQGVLKYLSSFDFLNAEAYENENSIKDSLINTEPYLIMSVEDRNGNVKEMTVFQMPINKRSKLQFDQYGNKVPYDLDRYYALINGGEDFVVIQNFVFGKVFKTYSDFLLRPSS